MVTLLSLGAVSTVHTDSAPCLVVIVTLRGVVVTLAHGTLVGMVHSAWLPWRVIIQHPTLVAMLSHRIMLTHTLTAVTRGGVAITYTLPTQHHDIVNSKESLVHSLFGMPSYELQADMASL